MTWEPNAHGRLLAIAVASMVLTAVFLVLGLEPLAFLLLAAAAVVCLTLLVDLTLPWTRRNLLSLPSRFTRFMFGHDIAVEVLGGVVTTVGISLLTLLVIFGYLRNPIDPKLEIAPEAYSDFWAFASIPVLDELYWGGAVPSTISFKILNSGRTPAQNVEMTVEVSAGPTLKIATLYLSRTHPAHSRPIPFGLAPDKVFYPSRRSFVRIMLGTIDADEVIRVILKYVGTPPSEYHEFELIVSPFGPRNGARIKIDPTGRGRSP